MLPVPLSADDQMLSGTAFDAHWADCKSILPFFEQLDIYYPLQSDDFLCAGRCGLEAEQAPMYSEYTSTTRAKLSSRSLEAFVPQVFTVKASTSCCSCHACYSPPSVKLQPAGSLQPSS